MEQKPPEFKDLIGYEGLYQIHCETGDIYSIPRQGCAGGKRTPYIHNEYPTLILSKGNKSRHVLVHRIVAENLVPNPDPDRFQFVKHIDKNKLNYSPSNLKWDVLARKPKKKKAGQPPVNGEWEVSELAKEAGQVYASRHIVPASEAYADGFTAGYFKAATPPASPAKVRVNEEEGQSARDAAAEYADQPYIGVNAIDTRKFDAFLAGVKWAKGQASTAKAEQESQDKRFIKEIGLLIGAPNPYLYTVADVEDAIKNGEQAEQEGPHIRQEDINAEWENFWKGIVCHPDGTINIDQLKKELHDFSYVMAQVPKVYCHITGDKLSKIMYPAETVIAVADDHLKEIIDQELKDYEHDVQDFVETASPREQEGLRWVKVTEEVLKSLSPELIYPFRYNFQADRRIQWEVEAGDLFDITDTYHNGWDDTQVLLESAPKEAGQVDPVALLHWTRKKVEISHATEWLVSNVKHTDEQILSLYLESLNKQP